MDTYMSNELITLTAAEGMTYTNGVAYGKVVYLGINDSPENWYEITDEEAELANQEVLPEEALAELVEVLT